MTLGSLRDQVIYPDTHEDQMKKRTSDKVFLLLSTRNCLPESGNPTEAKSTMSNVMLLANKHEIISE